MEQSYGKIQKITKGAKWGLGNCSMTLMMGWLEDPKGLSADEFSRRMERLGHYSLLAVAEF